VGKLVWLASYPKSGSTWMRAFLHNYITQPDGPHSINALTKFCVPECGAVFFKTCDDRAASEYTTQEVQKMRPLVHRNFMALHDDLVFVKTHNAAMTMHGVPLCTPEVTAGAIVIIRDPRDVALSYSRYTGLSVDETIAFMAEPNAANRSTAVQVFELFSTWSRHVESWVATKNRLLVRYEDMLADPAKSFGRVVKFLGGEAEPERLARAIAFSGFEVLSAQERADGFQAHAPDAVSSFFRVGRAGQWREAMTPAQMARIEVDHGAMMVSLWQRPPFIVFGIEAGFRGFNVMVESVHDEDNGQKFAGEAPA
jgi:hypothetical protein